MPSKLIHKGLAYFTRRSKLLYQFRANRLHFLDITVSMADMYNVAIGSFKMEVMNTKQENKETE